MTRLLTLLIFVAAYPLSIMAQWNADAGVIAPYSIVGATATSSTNTPNNVFDGNDNTNWQSNAPLPNGYRSRSDQNVFLGQSGLTLTASSNMATVANVTDGDGNTSVGITASNGKAFLNVHLNSPQSLLLTHFKLSFASPVTIAAYVFTSPTDSILLGNYSSSYAFTRYDMPTTLPITDLRIWATGNFTVYDVSAMATLPKESVTVDLGTLRDIGVLQSKHWGGVSGIVATAFYGSVDGTTWTKLADLNPQALARLDTRLATPMMARYLKIEHTLQTTDYLKCYVWEMAAYDRNGWQGIAPAATQSKVNLRQLLGVNGIWHWGYGNNWNTALAANPNIGSKQYATIVSQGRNYHNLIWDVSDPDQDPDFAGIDQHGALNAAWLNWNQEYGIWKNSGLNIESSIQFLSTSLPTSVWNTPYQSAYNYGHSFALHFGPTYGNGLVSTLEVGNEPWIGYDAAFYRDVLYGMARGAKEADPAFNVFPCALQAGRPQAENENYTNYMGARVSAREADYLDGINLHLYNFYYDAAGVRRSTYPEQALTQFWEILSGIRYRNTNMPNKKIYVTEWGWDAAGAGDVCTHNECVSETGQAVYAVRQALLMMRLGIERAHWFFYKNTDAAATSTLFSRSGLLTYNNQKKHSFQAFEAMNKLIGSRYFINTIQEDSTGYVYTLGDASGHATHIVAWRPISADISAPVNVSIPLPSGVSPMAAWHIEGTTSTGETAVLPSVSGGSMTASLTAIPLVIQIATPILSVQLLDFTGQRLESQNLLTWQTTNETNNTGFRIERKQSNSDKWDLLGFVASKDKRGTYNFTDEHPLSISYYRLRQIDEDNTETLSKIVSISTHNAPKLKVYPNPAKDFLVIETDEKDDFKIINVFGQQVIGGKVIQPIDVSTLPQGAYFLKIGEEQVKFFKQ